jgi:Flp pilus assembly protein TadG
MRRLLGFICDRDGTAAVEMALVAPFLLALMFGSFELGNFFMDQHALEKQVRDGARYGSRLAISDTYTCSPDPATVFADTSAAADIIKVTKDGVTTGTGNPRWGTYWDRTCSGGAPTLAVTVRCVDKDDIDKGASGNTGIYTSLEGETIPVVTVSGAVKYRSVLASLGFDATNICLRAESDAAVQGL